jgi:methionine synthase II (cobalamin-independent)
MGKKVLTLVLKEVDDSYNPVQDTQVTSYLDGEVSWDKMMPFFLHFLEGAGYVDVIKNMEKLLGGSMYDYETYFNSTVEDFINE